MNNPRPLLTCALSGALLTSTFGAVKTNPVADATNALGIDLYRQFATGSGNLCISPYSIQAAFAIMDGKSRTALFIGRVTDPR